MDSDEREVFYYLKTFGTEWVGGKEVCRRASTKQRFYEDANWAIPVLQRMREREILESDLQGRYRIKPTTKNKRTGRWVAPNIEKILKEGGIQVETEGETLGSDEHYEQL
jgi:hypothetical protein